MGQEPSQIRQEIEETRAEMGDTGTVEPDDAAAPIDAADDAAAV